MHFELRLQCTKLHTCAQHLSRDATTYKSLLFGANSAYRALNLLEGSRLLVAQCTAAHVGHPDGAFAAAEGKQIAVTGMKVSASDDLQEDSCYELGHCTSEYIMLKTYGRSFCVIQQVAVASYICAYAVLWTRPFVGDSRCLKALIGGLTAVHEEPHMAARLHTS